MDDGFGNKWNNEELLPCPFCGGKAEYERIDDMAFVYCLQCYARSTDMPEDNRMIDWQDEETISTSELLKKLWNWRQ